MREVTMGEAISEALHEEMRRDERVYVAGQFAYLGGNGQVTSLGREFGPERAVNAPLSETAIAGHAVGAALGGLRPVINLHYADFAFICMDEIVQRMGKWRYMHGAQGGMKLPIVVRMNIGGYTGGSSDLSGTPLAYFLHSPGLKMAVPSTPYEAKGLLKTAIRDDNPVIFFEHKSLIGVAGPVPQEEYTLPLGVADLKREGGDVTVVAIGFMVPIALQAAEELAKEGISLEVIDPRTLEPLDIDAIVRSVQKTGRLVVVDEDMERAGSAAEIAMQIMERAFDALRAPIRRVCAGNVPVPGSPPLKAEVLPQPEDVVLAARAVMAVPAR
jgi:pyruvate/2-oxoglutarate/acetoin dehydrogenase E1 component